MATPKQQKLIKLLMENYGVKGKTKTLSSLMIEAGYSKESSKNPKLILDSEVIQDGIEDFISEMDDKRRMAITQITKEKLEKAEPRELAYVADVLTKNTQLLNGGKTSNDAISIDWEK